MADIAPYTTKFWAKADKQNPTHIHLLEHHLADVGACFEALLSLPTMRQRLAQTGNRGDLDDTVVQRLAVFATLHDIGKINIGFQTKIWTSHDLANHPKRLRAGHTLDLAPVLNGTDHETCSWFFSSLGWEKMKAWDSNHGTTVSDMLIATLSHHGIPIQLIGKRHSNPLIWHPIGDLVPRKYLEHVVWLLHRWFPKAFCDGGTPLPSTPAFQHMFLGICTLADWLGSDETFFPYVSKPDNDYIAKARINAEKAVKAIGLDVTHQITSAYDFERLFSIQGSPNSIQQKAMKVPLGKELVIIESETGSGKTEAALLRFSLMYEAGLVDGMYFALPTRAAASQLHQRICDFSRNLFPEGNQPSPVLAVPGYLRAGNAKGHHLPNYQVWWEDEPDDATAKQRWAAESAKQFLAAQIAVGTVDQAMLAVLQVKHSHMRAACLARNLLVVDEVHASDSYMRVILKALLDAHMNAGGYAILMSATLGAVARQSWISALNSQGNSLSSLDDAIQVPYPAISVPSARGENVLAAGRNTIEKDVQIKAIQGMMEVSQVAQYAFNAAQQGAKVLIIRNTIAFARRTQLAIEEIAQFTHPNIFFVCHGMRTLHHGRFAAGDRQLLDRTVEVTLGKNRPDGGRVVVGTQTLEQSLDIDADLLITDLCPMDVLLQRIGRLHRHSRSDRPISCQAPICMVVLPRGADLSPLLTKGLNGLGPYDCVYQDLCILEATRRLIMDFSESKSPWRIPAMNRQLVEEATHPQALEVMTNSLGPEWLSHANEIKGVKIADGLTASNVLVKRDKSFYQDNQKVLFGDFEAEVRTRMGNEGFEVAFASPVASPFSRTDTISCLTIPAHMMRGAAVGEEPIVNHTTTSGFEFNIGHHRFQYDRLGLAKVDQQ